MGKLWEGSEVQSRDRVRAERIALDRVCQAKGLTTVPCDGGQEVDEVQGRGRRPGSHLVLAETQLLCSVCHRLKTDHPRIAGLIGLYGPGEQERRLLEHGVPAAAEALTEWSERKATATRHPGAPTPAGMLALARTRQATAVLALLETHPCN